MPQTRDDPPAVQFVTDEPEYLAALTATPCPRCGGTVEAITEDAGSGGTW